METGDLEGTAAGADTRMSDEQVRDGCLTVILAGHETTADALSFTLWMLAKHPDAQKAVHEESVRVLGAQRPNDAGDANLRHTYMVFAEPMRVYPPLWSLGAAAGRSRTISEASLFRPEQPCLRRRSSSIAIRGSGKIRSPLIRSAFRRRRS